MPKTTKRKLAGVAELTEHGWKVVDATAGSTTLSLPLTAKDKALMKGANSSTGFLSAGTASSHRTILWLSPVVAVETDKAKQK